MVRPLLSAEMFRFAQHDTCILARIRHVTRPSGGQERRDALSSPLGRGRDAGDHTGLSLTVIPDPGHDRAVSLRGGDQERMRVELREGEGFDQLLRRFNKGIERSGVIREHRRGLRFISVQEENRAKRRKAERRRRRNAAA